MKQRLHILVLFISMISSGAIAQNFERSIAILDLSERNEITSDSRVFSAEYMVKVAGISYVLTKDIDIAKNHAMIMCSSLLKGNTFTADEITSLSSYVGSGGTLLAPRVESEKLFELFGITSLESSKGRHTIHWDSTSTNKALRWIDEPEERTISLGRAIFVEIFKTIGYRTSTAQTLAQFNDGTSAVTSNVYGQGHAICVGLSWKEIILRNQINRDFEAQRVTSNGFEPSSDVFSLFVRGVFEQHQP